MKKSNLKNLSLNKKSISNLQSKASYGGVASHWPDTAKFCPDPSGGGGGPIDLPTIDIPTFNDSCFSLCDDKCNDW